MRMLKKTLTLKNKLGLHARASMKLIDLASRYACSVEVFNGKRSLNAKDILEVMSLGATQNTSLEVITNGLDEAEALAEIEKLFDDGFGEL